MPESPVLDFRAGSALRPVRPGREYCELVQGSLQRLVDLYNGDDTCLVIPVYQRNYDWKQEHCAQLFDDLVDTVRQNRPNHFFGAIVYKDEGSIGESTIIDGQQRLTTVNLLYLALCRSLEDGAVGRDERLAARIRNGYLRSEYAASGHKLKLKPVKADAAAYERLFGPREYFDESSNITANYLYLASRIERGELTPEQLFTAMRKLQVMRLKLEESDDAQLIFESLNSTGLDLSQADMIRNYILMGLDRATQDELYEEYWNRIEVSVDYDTSAFIRHYLTAKLGRTPKISLLYSEFRRFLPRGTEDVRSVLAEMRSYAKHSHDLRHAEVGIPKVDRLLARYRLVDRDVTFPLLLPVMEDFRSGALGAGDLLRIISAVDSYMARRWVCGKPTNALNKIFALMYRETSRQTDEHDSFADVLAYRLTHHQGSGVFPSDQEFKAALAARDFYSIQAAQRNYFWESLENGTSSDVRDIADALSAGDISIEHVMPQTLSQEWKDALGPQYKKIHETWLNRLGNLTVTGYNSSYSNASFAQKRDRDKGFRDSPYRVNHMLRDCERWGEDEMTQRSEDLSKAALEYWPMPTTAFQPAPGVSDVQPMGEETDFTGRRLQAWEYQGLVHPGATWKQMLVDVVRYLAEQDSAAVRRAAMDSGMNYLRSRSVSQPVPGGFSEIMPGLDIFSSNSTRTKMWILRDQFHHLGLDSDELVFHLSSTDQPDGEE